MTDNAKTLANIGAPKRPSLSFYHARADGTGSAMKLELVPATDSNDGYFILSLADQCSTSGALYPRFDWDNRIAVRLFVDDICKVLQVFRGETESIEDGRGIFHRRADGTMAFRMRHMIEPVCGYHIELRTDESASSIVLSHSEGLGACLAIEQSLGIVTFGVPQTCGRKDG